DQAVIGEELVVAVHRAGQGVLDRQYRAGRRAAGHRGKGLVEGAARKDLDRGAEKLACRLFAERSPLALESHECHEWRFYHGWRVGKLANGSLLEVYRKSKKGWHRMTDDLRLIAAASDDEAERILSIII